MKKKNSLKVPYVSSVTGKEEVRAVIKALNTSTQMSKNVKLFEKKISNLYGYKYGIATNSGSSSLLLGMEALNIPKGSEVITPSLTFSTTVSCILKNNLIPTFVDCKSLSELIIDTDRIEKLITKKTRALCIPNLLGNMPDWIHLKYLAKKYNLLILDDSADLIGARYKNKLPSFYSDISITSFYGAHMITCAGNGGIVMTSNTKFMKKIKLLRSWGRRSSLFSDSETINKRFNVKINNFYYDSKFIFDEVGYMMEPSEIGCAYGLAQLKKLKKFSALRKKNSTKLISVLKKYDDLVYVPKMNPDADSVWFAIPIVLKNKCKFSRKDFQIYLERRNIQTRVIFTGNIIRQPGFKFIKKKLDPNGYQISDYIMENGLLVGCHHGMNNNQLNHLTDSIEKFLKQ